jgi:V-type H+-transporting ATPase subunit A
LDEYNEKEQSGFAQLKDKIKQLLYSSGNLKQLTQLVGKTAIDDHDRITLDVASLVEKAFYSRTDTVSITSFALYGKLSI